MRDAKVLVTLPVLLALAACSTPQPPETGPEPVFPVAGKVENFDEVPVPTFVSLVAIDHAILGPAASAPGARVTEYAGAFLALDSVPLAPDGSFAWDLGDGSDIPDAYLAEAAQAFGGPDAACSLTASGSTPVLKTMVVSGLLYPIGVLGPLSEGAAYWDGSLLYTDAASVSPPPTTPFRTGTWTYAAEAVSIEGTCVVDRVLDPDLTVTIDVDLEAGWNALTMATDPDADTATVTTGTFEGAWLALPAGVM